MGEEDMSTRGHHDDEATGEAAPPAKRARLDDDAQGSRPAGASGRLDGEAEGSRRPAEEASASASDADRPAWFARAASAQWWYYETENNGLQGPFYPGQMRDWLSAGYFGADH